MFLVYLGVFCYFFYIPFIHLFLLLLRLVGWLYETIKNPNLYRFPILNLSLSLVSFSLPEPKKDRKVSNR
jgi:hypothetical protein